MTLVEVANDRRMLNVLEVGFLMKPDKEIHLIEGALAGLQKIAEELSNDWSSAIMSSTAKCGLAE